MKELDPLSIPLKGTYIIEASAGTGKTFAISNIFLRLVLEKGLPVEKILIVSFTEAATNELRHRIRKRLHEALVALHVKRIEDIFLEKLSKRIENKEDAIDRIRRAIRDLDRLHISTIHGFCRRVIADNAFESGALLDTQLVGNQEFIKQEIIYDFWRNYIYSESPLFIDFLNKKGFNPENASRLIDQYLIRPYVKVIPEHIDSIDKTEVLERDYLEIFKQVCKLWDRNLIEDLINQNKVDRKIYKKRSLEKWLSYLDDSLNLYNFGLLKSDIVKRLVWLEIDHPFFKQIRKLSQIQEKLENNYHKRLIFLKKALIEFTEKGLEKKKHLKNIMSFDDLIRFVHRSIQEQEILVNALRNRFSAAMIDEFQDTDSLQYEIFKRIFDEDDYTLYLIGDPKQSIYSFRGADIFTYIKASKEIKEKFTLKENWRSYSRLIEVTNRIFSLKETPFLYKDILFLPSRPAQKSDTDRIYLDRSPEPVLKIWLFNKKEYRKKDIAKEKIAKAVSEEIVRIINLSDEGRLSLGERPVKASDIAVLVRRNTEVELIKRELSSLHIPTIIYSTTNVFDSWECREVKKILKGIYLYNKEVYLKAAIGTDIIGIKGEEMEKMDESEWEDLMKRFEEYHNIWKRHGFINMFRHFLNKEQVIPRLMEFEDGERRCTNVLHLMELIHIAEKENMLGMEGVIRWLDVQKMRSIPKMEEYQLRLESDESAVRIITIHRSKGLEFPIVFIPFAWDTIEKRQLSRRPLIFHSQKDETYILDLGTDLQEKHLDLAIKESLSEDLRLLYVAITRAKSCCYLVYNEDTSSYSSLSYLFSKNPKEIFEDMKEDVLVYRLPEPKGEKRILKIKEEEISNKTFSGKIDTSWQITSFSSLVSNRPYIEEAQDIDAIQEEGEEEEAVSFSMDIFSFPKGAKAGTFFHDLLEHLDFKEKNEEKIRDLISTKLLQYGFEGEWEDVIFENIKELLETPIDPDMNGLRLSEISKEERISEMEFYFPLKKINAKEIEEILREWNLIEKYEIPHEIDQLIFDPVEGFMRGFMDMVFSWNRNFFLVDWKSNFLGNKKEDYHFSRLEKEMKEKFYFLQLLIYTVALDQYLRVNIKDYSYERDFGKAYYIFLRGISKEKGPEFGIYRYKPASELIDSLRKLLLPDYLK